MVACLNGVQEVSGSNPDIPTIFLLSENYASQKQNNLPIRTIQDVPENNANIEKKDVKYN